METFSERNNLRTIDIPITIRNDARDDFRLWLIEEAKNLGISIKAILTIICTKTFQAEDGNWGENFIESEAKDKLRNCKWYFVYDVVEYIYQQLSTTENKYIFEKNTNTYFQVNGYGYKMENGLIQYRGDTIQEQTFDSALEILQQQSPTAHNELKLALSDLSKRPEADTTGTVHHALGALECFCGLKYNMRSSTLGKIVKNNRSAIPQPLDQVIEQLWGFASNCGRHVHEGNTASAENAELTLNICSSLIVYLSKIISTN